MPQDRNVVLNYDSDHRFGPDPARIRVLPGDAIHFSIGESTKAAVPNCKLKITIHQEEHFSKKVVQHDGPPDKPSDAVLTVSVQPAPAAALAAAVARSNGVISGYKCELLDGHGKPMFDANGKQLFLLDGQDSGGEIELDPGGG